MTRRAAATNEAEDPLVRMKRLDVPRCNKFDNDKDETPTVKLPLAIALSRFRLYSPEFHANA